MDWYSALWSSWSYRFGLVAGIGVSWALLGVFSSVYMKYHGLATKRRRQHKGSSMFNFGVLIQILEGTRENGATRKGYGNEISSRVNDLDTHRLVYLRILSVQKRHCHCPYNKWLISTSGKSSPEDFFDLRTFSLSLNAPANSPQTRPHPLSNNRPQSGGDYFYPRCSPTSSLRRRVFSRDQTQKKHLRPLAARQRATRPATQKW